VPKNCCCSLGSSPYGLADTKRCRAVLCPSPELLLLFMPYTCAGRACLHFATSMLKDHKAYLTPANCLAGCPCRKVLCQRCPSEPTRQTKPGPAFLLQEDFFPSSTVIYLLFGASHFSLLCLLQTFYFPTWGPFCITTIFCLGKGRPTWVLPIPITQVPSIHGPFLSTALQAARTLLPQKDKQNLGHLHLQVPIGLHGYPKRTTKKGYLLLGTYTGFPCLPEGPVQLPARPAFSPGTK